MKRSTYWLLLAIGLVSVVVIVYRFKSIGAYHPHQAPPATQADKNPAPVPIELRPVTQLQGSTQAGEKKKDLLTVLRERVSEIAGHLPDLNTVQLERALRYHSIAPRRRHDLRRNPQGQVESFINYEPKYWDQIDFEVPDYVAYNPLPDDRGFHSISTIILEHLFQSASKDDEARVRLAYELAAFIQSPEDALGDSPDARKVLLAARWQAAMALRRVPISSEQVVLLSTIASNHTDEVLRGAVAGALLANLGTTPFISDWLIRERTPRTLQAFLVELVRRDRISHFPPSSNARVTKGEGEGFQVDYEGGMRVEEKAASGPDLFDILAAKLIQSADTVVGAEIKPYRTLMTESGKVRQFRTPFEDTKGYLIESLRLRADASKAPMLLQLIDIEPNGEYRARLITALGETRAPDASVVLTRFATAATTVNERKAAINGLAISEDSLSRTSLETLLWDKDVVIRGQAGQGLYTSDHKRNLSERARLRIGEMAQDEGLDGTKGFFTQFAAWLDRNANRAR